MPKRIDPPFDLKSFMAHGDQFHLNMMLIGRQPNHVFPSLATPFVASAAFALEIYFKVLANIERHLLPLKTHNLLHLFNDMIGETRDRLERRWTNECLPKIQAQFDSPYLPSDFPKLQTFRQALEMSADAFVIWRYAPRSRNRSFPLPDLVPITREIIIERRPELGRTGEVVSEVGPDTKWD